MDEQARCELCGQPMPPGEEMFKYHGYSGPCPLPPKVQKLADEKPQVKELLDKLPPGSADKLWTLKPGGLQQLAAGDIEGLSPEKPEDIKTFDEVNASGKTMTFLCMQWSKTSGIRVPGSVVKYCDCCKSEVAMSPGTCIAYAQAFNPKIICEQCAVEILNKEKEDGEPSL